jgi:hypothetical protein
MVLAHVTQGHARPKVILDKLPRRARQQDLSAVPRGHHPSRTMHGQADIPLRPYHRLTGMYTHPDPQLGSVWPRMRLKASLAVDRRRDSVLRTAERHEE